MLDLELVQDANGRKIVATVREASRTTITSLATEIRRLLKDRGRSGAPVGSRRLTTRDGAPAHDPNRRSIQLWQTRTTRGEVIEVHNRAKSASRGGGGYAAINELRPIIRGRANTHHGAARRSIEKQWERLSQLALDRAVARLAKRVR